MSVCMYVGHGCKALQPPHHLLPKSLHSQVTTSPEWIHQTKYMCGSNISMCMCVTQNAPVQYVECDRNELPHTMCTDVS